MKNRIRDAGRGDRSLGDAASASQPGIALTLLWLVSSTFEDLGFESLLEGEGDFDPGDRVDIEPEANVWFSEDRVAMVQLSVRVSPKKQPTFSAYVSYAAQYVATADSPIISLQEFAWGNGLANLVPFVRARLAELTGESRFPTFYLQPLNLRGLQLASEATGEYAAPQLPAPELPE